VCEVHLDIATLAKGRVCTAYLGLINKTMVPKKKNSHPSPVDPERDENVDEVPSRIHLLLDYQPIQPPSMVK